MIDRLIASAFIGSFARPLDLDLFGRPDPGMRVPDERRDLINAGLPIDEAGNAIPEKIDE